MMEAGASKDDPVPVPESRVGRPVEFKPPISVGEMPTRKGTIKDEIWSKVYPDPEWGHYIYTSQLIEWENGERSVRLTYYYLPAGASRWLFGGQYSIEDSPAAIHEFLT